MTAIPKGGLTAFGHRCGAPHPMLSMRPQRFLVLPKEFILMGPRPDPVTSDNELPAKADVVVIGGGIIGTSAALELAERGISVVLCEKGTIGAEQSSRNW